jgi:hypothetical protein
MGYTTTYARSLAQPEAHLPISHSGGEAAL